jgi:sulfite reductase (NADPH) hemoprotein beta-component
MYTYNFVDQQLVDERVAQFRDQTRRYLSGNLEEEVFKQLRLRNGLYVQRHAPMLRVAIPYGVMNSTQLRRLGRIARQYDRGYAHVTTRQNFQFNWPTLESVPEILAELAGVQMHAIQTSGNCIRNITADPLAGEAPDEIEDPRIWCELLRQWSTLHPEFSFLPRKFKIAVTGAAQDRVASQVHDIGLQMVRNDHGKTGFRVLVGGGLGRTPVVGKQIRGFLPKTELLSYLDAILRVYNLHGRRDNIYKARIKILVQAIGIEAFREQVETEWQYVRESSLKLDDVRIEEVANAFKIHRYRKLENDKSLPGLLAGNPVFASWYRQNTRAHRLPGYRIVFLSLKNHGQAPGDISAEQMTKVADLAELFSFGEIRTTYSQNLILAQVEQSELYALWQALVRLHLANPNIGTVNDVICCPGFDFCALANATSIDVAEDIQNRFARLDRLFGVGEVKINISGCMNACGHHHVGNIGLLGVSKNGADWYQITLGGSASNHTALGKVLGPAVEKQKIGHAVEAIIETYLELRAREESFLDTLQRLGRNPFKERVYASCY